jgi:hypothetical protein
MRNRFPARIGLCLAAVLLAAAGLAGPGPGPRAPVQYVPHSDSRVWIEGDAEVRRFECHVDRVKGRAVLGPGGARKKAGADGRRRLDTDDGPSHVEVQVPVRRFECGKEPMNEDLYEALKAEAHPRISYEMLEARLLDRPDTSGWQPIRATGDLTVAGTERLVEIVARGRRLGPERVEIRGEHRIDMTDFGVEPPQALFGLIQVQDRITVHFDLVGVPDTIQTNR